MIPAPFTNGADLQTDWFFEYFRDNHNGKYLLQDDMRMIFHGGDGDFYYEASIKFRTNHAYIRLVAGCYIDNEFIETILQDLLGDIREHPDSVIDYEFCYDLINDVVNISFYYKDDE